MSRIKKKSGSSLNIKNTISLKLHKFDYDILQSI